MTTKDLFRCIGNLSDGMIEEAADIRRKPRWLPIAALAERPVVVDDANLFTASEEAQIEAAARTIVDTYQVDVVVVTSYAPKPEQSQAFADDYFDYNGYGVGEDEAGLL